MGALVSAIAGRYMYINIYDADRHKHSAVEQFQYFVGIQFSNFTHENNNNDRTPLAVENT